MATGATIHYGPDIIRASLAIWSLALSSGSEIIQKNMGTFLDEGQVTKLFQQRDYLQ